MHDEKTGKGNAENAFPFISFKKALDNFKIMMYNNGVVKHL